MLKVKEAVKQSFNNKKIEYSPIMQVIDKRWKKQIGHKLHATSYYFNPLFHYHPKSTAKSPIIMLGVVDVLEKLCREEGTERNVNKELSMLECGLGDFGRPYALTAIKRMDASEW